MDDSEKKEIWLPITEYAIQRNKSISTIRRYIKANRVKHRLVNGKYFIKIQSIKLKKFDSNQTKIKKMEHENKLLKDEVRKLKENVQEFKMLIKLYEEENKKHIRSLSVPPVIEY